MKRSKPILPRRTACAPVTPEQLKARISSDLFLDALAGAAREMCEPRPGTVLRAEIMAVGLLYSVIERWPALRAMYSRLVDGSIPGFAAVKATESAFYDRLKCLPHNLMLELLAGMTPTQKAQKTLGRVQKLAPFATGFGVIDESTLDALARKSLDLRKHARANEVVLAGRIACLMDMASRHVMRLVYEEDADANEKTHIKALLEDLAEGTLLTFDLGYFAFWLFDLLTERNLWFVSRMREKTSFVVKQTLAITPHYVDRIIWLGAHTSERAAHPVRLVEIKVNGQWWRYITNVLDPRKLRADAVWALYCCRWSIEKIFAVIKRELGMAYIHMTSLNGMLLQLWSTLIIYSILQDLRLEIAAAHGWDDDDVSWRMLLRYITMYSERDRGGQSLVDYLLLPRKHASLKKAGVRKRRITELSEKVMDDILGASFPEPIPVASRKPRARTWPKKSRALCFAAPMR